MPATVLPRGRILRPSGAFRHGACPPLQVTPSPIVSTAYTRGRLMAPPRTQKGTGVCAKPLLRVSGYVTIPTWLALLNQSIVGATSHVKWNRQDPSCGIHRPPRAPAGYFFLNTPLHPVSGCMIGRSMPLTVPAGSVT